MSAIDGRRSRGPNCSARWGRPFDQVQQDRAAGSGTSTEKRAAMHDPRRSRLCPFSVVHRELRARRGAKPHGPGSFPTPQPSGGVAEAGPKGRSGVVRSPAAPDSATEPQTLKRHREPQERHPPGLSAFRNRIRETGWGPGGSVRRADWGERSFSPQQTLKRTPGRRDATGGILEGKSSTAAADGERRFEANENRTVVW